MGFFKKNKSNQQAVQKVSLEPFATVVGYGRWGYRVRVETPGNYYVDNQRYFKFGRARAERYAERKLAIAKQKFDHKTYSKTYTIKAD